MKKITAAICMIFPAMILALSLHATGNRKIIIGYFTNPPHIYFSNGRHTGALVDYWEKYVAPEMNMEIEWVGPLPPLRLFAKLETGEINCIALLSKNPEREKIYDFPESYFRKVNGGLAVLRENKLSRIDSINDFKGLRIGFFQNGYIPPTMKKVNIRWDLLTESTWKEQCLHKMLLGRLDAVFEPDRLTLDYELSINPALNRKIIVLDIPGTASFNYSVFSKMDNGKFLTLYNKAHKRVLEKNSALYTRLLNDIFKNR